MDTRTTRPAAMAAACVLAWCGGIAAQPAAAATPLDAVLIDAVRPDAAGLDAARLDAARLDLPGAIRRALEQPALRAAAHEVAASEAAAGQAGNLPNPELAYLREGQDSGARTTTVQLSQPIELGGKRRARVALARGEAALAHSELAARRREVRAEVIAAYYAVLVAQEQQALAQALIDLARRGVDVAARRVAAGKVSPIDETRARLAAVDAVTGLAEAKAALAIARTRLGALIGIAPDGIALVGREAAIFPDGLPDMPPLETLLARAAEAGAVGRARSQLATQQAQAGVERAARMPDLMLTLGTQRDDGAGRRQAVVGLAVPLPLFNRNGGRLEAALRRTDKARDELAAAEAGAAAELRTASIRYTGARDEATLLQRDVIPQAHQAWTLTLKGFEAGKFAFLDVLDAQRTWFQARSRRAAALLAAWRAYADIERLAGTDQQQN
jgi:cobalt-zinc-cadmium efflux system outer membrane protein